MPPVVRAAVKPLTIAALRLQQLAQVGMVEDMDLPRTSSIGDFIREQREAAQVSVRQLAKLTGVSNPYLSQIERGLRKPSAEILQQIAHGLSISAEQLYTRAGLLESRAAASDVSAAILADPELSERHKHVLVEIYQSFRRESVPADTASAAAAASAASTDDAATTTSTLITTRGARPAAHPPKE